MQRFFRFLSFCLHKKNVNINLTLDSALTSRTPMLVALSQLNLPFFLAGWAAHQDYLEDFITFIITSIIIVIVFLAGWAPQDYLEPTFKNWTFFLAGWAPQDDLDCPLLKIGHFFRALVLFLAGWAPQDYLYCPLLKIGHFFWQSELLKIIFIVHF